MRHKLLEVCSSTFHSLSETRKPTFPKAGVAGGTRVGHEEVLPPCGHFLYLQLVHCMFTAAAAAKSLQSCPTPCDPIDRSPPVSHVPGILQARTLEWVAISFSNA